MEPHAFSHTRTLAASRWRGALEALAIPEAILARAPASPHGFAVERFARAADQALEAPPTPSTSRALEALPPSGTVLDVGCGAGASSLPLARHASLLIGLDESPAMLEAFAERASALGAPARTIAGRWPDVAPLVPVADVVVCAHVAYNVPDLAAFVTALSDHARRRVVLELTAEHPLAWMAPFWRVIHHVERPWGPTADDALAVLAELGLEVEQQRWFQSFTRTAGTRDDLIAFLRRRLCVGPERDADIAEALERFGVPRQRAVLSVWWQPASV